MICNPPLKKRPNLLLLQGFIIPINKFMLLRNNFTKFLCLKTTLKERKTFP